MADNVLMKITHSIDANTKNSGVSELLEQSLEGIDCILLGWSSYMTSHKLCLRDIL